jgi:hypothetical protein
MAQKPKSSGHSKPAKATVRPSAPETAAKAAVVEKPAASDAEAQVALDKIDVATTKAGDNLSAISRVVATIRLEVQGLVSNLQSYGAPQSLVAQAMALSTRMEAVGGDIDALVPVLKAIAAEGAVNPVPLPVPAETTELWHA